MPETTDQFALAVLIELRREYAQTQRKLALWLSHSQLLQLEHDAAMAKKRESMMSNQLHAARERVYTLRVEIAQLQRDLDMAVKECRRLNLAIPEDFSGYYVERTNVKPKS